MAAASATRWTITSTVFTVVRRAMGWPSTDSGDAMTKLVQAHAQRSLAVALRMAMQDLPTGVQISQRLLLM